MIKQLPTYYQKSKVVNSIVHSIEAEFERLKTERDLTETQFFVVLADRDIAKHESDAGLVPDSSADIEARRGRVLSRLRGTGTVTKTMMKNVAASFVNGKIEITEYPSQYCFSVKFNSRTGIPYNLDDIKNMINEIKPAHLEVEYIFTYRLWQDVRDELTDWNTTKNYTWDELLSFEVILNIRITDTAVFYCPEETGNAKVVWDGKRAYARMEE